MNDEPELGKWATVCCCTDAYEIKTKKQLEEIMEELKDGNDIGISVFKDKEDLIRTVCACRGICKLNPPPPKHK